LSFPVTEKIHAEALSLPIGPLMQQKDIIKVAEVMNTFMPQYTAVKDI
jgi:dTDP-4-amino-4,6-dideoxygalactose transaminase